MDGGSAPYTIPDPLAPVARPVPVIRKPLMTWGIAVFLGIVFLLQLVFGRGDSELPLGRMGGLNGEWIRHGETWELLTAAFLHAGIAHIGMNVLALVSIGSLLEVLIGRRRLLVAFLVSALVGNLAAAIPSTPRITIGASGGLWGLMTLLAVLVLRRSTLVPPRLAENLRPRMIRALVINAAVSFIPGVSWLAHLGGGIAGAALALTGVIERDAKPFPAPETKPLWLTAWVGSLAVLSAVSLGAAFASGRPWELLRPPTLERAVVRDVSLPIPKELRSRADPPSTDPGTSETVFGDLERDGIFVDVTLRTPGEIPSDPIATFESWKASGRLQPIQGFSFESVQVVRGARPRLEIHATAPSGASYVEYRSFVGTRLVILLVLRLRESSVWPGVEQKIYDGLGPR